MIILKIKAGLGNQMFQYAYARALQLRSEKAFGTQVPLKIDLSWFKEQNLAKDTERFYELSHFNIKENIATANDICANFAYIKNPAYKFLIKIVRKVQREVLGFSDYVYYPHLAKPVQKTYIDSYFWNSEKYFKDSEDVLRSEFTLKEPLSEIALGIMQEIEEDAQAGNIPVLVAVRRGDYAANAETNAHHGTKSVEWYQNAMEILKVKLGKEASKISLWVASDDISWAKEHLLLTGHDGSTLPLNAISRTGLNAYEELIVMGSCKHFIIANSTFHWWGAWLSKNSGKIVIGPKKWLNNLKINTKDVMPPEWIRI